MKIYTLRMVAPYVGTFYDEHNSAKEAYGALYRLARLHRRYDPISAFHGVAEEKNGTRLVSIRWQPYSKVIHIHQICGRSVNI